MTQRPMLSTPTLPRKTFAFLLGGVLLVELVACGSSTPMSERGHYHLTGASTVFTRSAAVCEFTLGPRGTST